MKNVDYNRILQQFCFTKKEDERYNFFRGAFTMPRHLQLGNKTYTCASDNFNLAIVKNKIELAKKVIFNQEAKCLEHKICKLLDFYSDKHFATINIDFAKIASIYEVAKIEYRKIPPKSLSMVIIDFNGIFIRFKHFQKVYRSFKKLFNNKNGNIEFTVLNNGVLSLFKWSAGLIEIYIVECNKDDKDIIIKAIL